MIIFNDLIAKLIKQRPFTSFHININTYNHILETQSNTIFNINFVHFYHNTA